MPQLLNFGNDLSPEEELIKNQMMAEVFPEYSHQNFAQQLKLNGYGIDSLAREYAESLSTARPEIKLAAIEKILKLMGVDANVEINKEAVQRIPTVNIHLSGSNSQNLLQLIAPKRERSEEIA